MKKIKKLITTLAFIAWAAIAQCQLFYTAETLAIADKVAGDWVFGDWQDTDLRIFLKGNILYVNNKNGTTIHIKEQVFKSDTYDYKQIGWVGYDEKDREVIIKFRYEKENGVLQQGTNIYIFYSDVGVGVVYHAIQDD